MKTIIFFSDQLKLFLGCISYSFQWYFCITTNFQWHFLNVAIFLRFSSFSSNKRISVLLSNSSNLFSNLYAPLILFGPHLFWPATFPKRYDPSPLFAVFDHISKNPSLNNQPNSNLNNGELLIEEGFPVLRNKSSGSPASKSSAAHAQPLYASKAKKPWSNHGSKQSNFDMHLLKRATTNSLVSSSYAYAREACYRGSFPSPGKRNAWDQGASHAGQCKTASHDVRHATDVSCGL